jgi:hypothetical protein
MFVLARKIASARYDENCPAELTRVVRENR